MRIPSYIKDNLLLKITSLNSGAVFIRMLLSVVSQKVIALLLGPVGVAQIGNFRNLLPIIESFSTGGISNGIVKYVAEYKEDKSELQRIFSTVFVFLFCGTILVFSVLFFGAEYLNEWMFNGKHDFVFVFRLLAIGTPFLALNKMFFAIANGLSAYKEFIKINLMSYVLSTLIMLVFVYYKKLDGALIALAINPLILVAFFLKLYYKVLKEYVTYKQISFTVPYSKNFRVFILMTVFSAVISSFINIKLRLNLMKSINPIDAGNWTAMTNLSSQYFTFISGIFTLYVLPKFSTIKKRLEFKIEVLKIYKTLLPLVAVGMLFLYFFRESVVLLLQSEEFLGMKYLFKWQLLGDFVKVASLVVAYQFLAKKMLKEFVVTEIISLVLFYVFADFFMDTLGAEGIVLAHFLRYVIYFLAVLFALRKYLYGDAFAEKEDLLE